MSFSPYSKPKTYQNRFPWSSKYGKKKDYEIPEMFLDEDDESPVEDYFSPKKETVKTGKKKEKYDDAITKFMSSSKPSRHKVSKLNSEKVKVKKKKKRIQSDFDINKYKEEERKYKEKYEEEDKKLYRKRKKTSNSPKKLTPLDLLNKKITLKNSVKSLEYEENEKSNGDGKVNFYKIRSRKGKRVPSRKKIGKKNSFPQLSRNGDSSRGSTPGSSNPPSRSQSSHVVNERDFDEELSRTGSGGYTPSSRDSKKRVTKLKKKRKNKFSRTTRPKMSRKTVPKKVSYKEADDQNEFIDMNSFEEKLKTQYNFERDEYDFDSLIKEVEKEKKVTKRPKSKRKKLVSKKSNPRKRKITRKVKRKNPPKPRNNFEDEEIVENNNVSNFDDIPVGGGPKKPPVGFGGGGGGLDEMPVGGKGKYNFDDLPIGGGGNPNPFEDVAVGGGGGGNPFGGGMGMGEEKFEEIQRVKCQFCERKFAVDRIKKHRKICSKPKKKRKVIDFTKKRVGKEGKKLFVQQKRQERRTVKKKKSTWRQKHKQFQAALKVTPSGGGGGPTPEELDDRVPCPHCGRKFSQLAADRHIPKCANIVNRPSNRYTGGRKKATSRRTTTSTNRNKYKMKKKSRRKYY